jgi:HD-GYP domain-containing protein (c-di-GMP phosphodiesterase class II)
MQDGSLSTILALAAAVDARDPYTHGHSERVTAYALKLGEAVGMPEEELKILRISGLLHDVGKIGVPDHVLKKPGRLTDEERETMETHPVIGEIICRRAAGLEPYLPGIRWHHERWDGNGYPDGLAQTKTPLMARVLAVADTFDAMTSDRPYRRGMPWMVALEEIRQSAGSQLDPDLAETFYQIFLAEAQAKDASREAKIPKAA